MSLYENIFNFFKNWLYGDNIPNNDIISFNGTLFNFSINHTFIVNFLTFIVIGLTLFIAFYVIKWFINFIMGGVSYER